MPPEAHQEEIEAQLRGLVPTPSGSGVFLEADDKVIAIFIDSSVAASIGLYLQGVEKPRPFTHDLMGNMLSGFGIKVLKVVVCDLIEDTFYARILLKQQNELGTNLIEVDSRPSDAMAIALQQEAPIFVVRKVVDAADDMAWALEEATEPAGDDEPQDDA